MRARRAHRRGGPGHLVAEVPAPGVYGVQLATSLGAHVIARRRTLLHLRQIGKSCRIISIRPSPGRTPA
jgi:hypothetical protein